ncbi:helix-turn-helix domain-containing protein [Brevundimonas sp.]|uniref:IclR family transcriptional regulator n=1 Tax=Brevundimonas sp. TaxID=1871086 RepID=UPI0019B8B936|nr:helix-turn-helix domain-containing protein [Brevundimonas sp.]MBD3835569.1 helix-turn-helix domain-containing protein [Brevundimonas sp.]
MDDETDRKYRAPALEKGLDVLELLSAHGRPMTPSQMSVELGRSVSELFRMIQVLEFRRYIEPTPEGYRLTNRLFSLGMAQAPAKSLVEAALPVMRDLASQTVQSCHLVVPTEDQIVVIARIEGPGDLGYSVRLGYRRNIIDASSGLMFYGKANEKRRAELRALLEPRYGAARVADYVAAAEVAGARGHVRRPSDFVQGVTDLVAPIMGADGVIATLITPYIQREPPVCGIDEALDHLRAAVETISSDMGAVAQP